MAILCTAHSKRTCTLVPPDDGGPLQSLVRYRIKRKAPRLRGAFSESIDMSVYQETFKPPHSTTQPEPCV